MNWDYANAKLAGQPAGVEIILFLYKNHPVLGGFITIQQKHINQANDSFSLIFLLTL